MSCTWSASASTRSRTSPSSFIADPRSGFATSTSCTTRSSATATTRSAPHSRLVLPAARSAPSTSTTTSPTLSASSWAPCIRELAMDTSDLDIDALLKRLHLANARRVWRDLIARAETEEWSCRDFLALLVAEEVAHRKQTRLQRVTSRCGFPFLKTVDDFDFTYQSTVKLSLLGSALSPDFVTDGRSLILHGKPGRGKTHIAIAVGYRAIQNGFDTLFVTAAELIEDLSVASREGRLADALTRYVTPHVLVCDEVGYLTYGPDAANVLYHVVNKRHPATRAMVFTSNKHPDDWGAVLHDDDLAAAIVDRVLERGRLLHLDGPSMRTKHLRRDARVLDEGQPSAAAPARSE